MFEHTILPSIVLLGLCAVVIYGYWTQRRSELTSVREDALGEAARAIQSLADVAEISARTREDEGQGDAAQDAYARAYYYNRAASIVRSIPVDRV